MNQSDTSSLTFLGTSLYGCEEDFVCTLGISKIPYFNALVYTSDKKYIGKIEDVFGPTNDIHFTIKTEKDNTIKKGSSIYIPSMKLLPMEIFLNPTNTKKRSIGDRNDRSKSGDRGRNDRSGDGGRNDRSRSFGDRSNKARSFGGGRNDSRNDRSGDRGRSGRNRNDRR
eukprot:GHVP01041023.1.p1 GENE.GHVP01041023.1~~GHVP01041023.1.p1  ORF type:complete len:182 (+),score=30.23 GHVP01041023.1:40-546(+)